MGLIAVLTGAAPALRPLPPQPADTSATRTQRITNRCRISAIAATADAGEKASSSILPCPCCGKTMEFVRRIKPLDLWIRTPLTPPPAATGWTPGQARPPNPGSPPDPPCS